MYPTLKKKDYLPQGAFPLAVLRREPQLPFGPHAHEFAELVIITGGRGMHVVGSQSWPLSTGDVFVISGSRPHDYQDLNDLRLINILFDAKRLQLRLLDLPSLSGYHALLTLEPAWRKRHEFKSRLHLSARELDAAIAIVDQLEKELSDRSAGFAFVATALFMQLIAMLSRCFSHTRNPDSRALLRIGQAISHLETHFHQAIHLDDLARIAHMSRRSFCRAFAAAKGSSPINHLLQLRVQRAATLLRQTDEAVTAIAYKVGFTDSNYFTRQFRRIIGSSPRAYRDRVRTG